MREAGLNLQRNLISYNKLRFWLIALLLLLASGGHIFINSLDWAGPPLLINEVVAVNSMGLRDEDGQPSDWIELYNPGRQSINLSGWALTDDSTQPEKWPLPDVSLAGHAYLVIFASGKNRTANRDALHTNFKLGQAGEFLGLYHILSRGWAPVSPPKFAQALPLPRQFTDVAYGRYGDNLSYGYLTHPTPGQPNDESQVWQSLVEPVRFSLGRGFYEVPFSLELTTATPGATIRYTLDGSEPTAEWGLVYAEPLWIESTSLVRAAAFKPNQRPSPVETHTYLFLDQVLRQPAQPPGFPTTWGQHTIDFGGYDQGAPVLADYEMDPEVVDNPRYRDSLKAALTAIPTLSLVTDVQNFYLYANPRERGPAWERLASVELFDPTGGQPGFQINAGVRIQGGAGRWEFMPKHSFRLFFRARYGADSLNTPLFAGSPVERFNTLILRAGADRSYAGHPEHADHHLATYTRDEWLRASQEAMSGVAVHGLFVHLYLNGLYWGLYNVVERPDAAFAASYFGRAKEAWYTVNHSGSISGSSDRFETLLKLAEQGDLDKTERYEALAAYIDLPHFIDYVILNWYAGNRDWPANNWYANIRNPDGQLRYFVWDGEETWFDGAWIHLDQAGLVGSRNTVKLLFEALSQNPDFRLQVADRIYKHLFNEGALTVAQAQARWLAVNAPVEPAIVAESARWGDVRYDAPVTQADWYKARDQVLAQMAGNVGKFIQQARAAGYYPDLDPPDFNRHGGPIEAGFKLTMQAPAGLIYFTTDGSDPRTPAGGAVAPAASSYSEPLILQETTQVKARVLAGDQWSALHEAIFTVPTGPPALRITEIMYHPPDGDQYEFIELKNTGRAPVELAGDSFEGIRFTFPPHTAPLAPGHLLVLAADAGAFAARYPAVTIEGVYDGQLSNNGESITIRDKQGQVLTTVAYGDRNGWPLSPDGHGDSLVWVEVDSDPNDPHTWRASSRIGGSPGEDSW